MRHDLLVINLKFVYLFLLKSNDWIKVYFMLSLKLALFRMEGAKRPPTSFSPVTFPNVEISPRDVLTYSFNLFVTLLHYRTWTKTKPKKKIALVKSLLT